MCPYSTTEPLNTALIIAVLRGRKQIATKELKIRE